MPEGEGDRCAGLRAMAVQVRETLAKASRCSPDARLVKGTKRWDDEGFCFENRRSAGESPPSVLPELTGAMNVFRCDGSTWRGIVNFMVRFVGKGACAAAKIGGESR